MDKQTHTFKTEVQQLLNLVIHSLYSKKEIFVRELISNASDAIDRVKFEGLTDTDLLRDGGEFQIRIAADKAARTLTFSDNGIGMNAAELEQNIGTIANSGTRLFLEKIRKEKAAAGPEMIGQFGVGFYSAFMAADQVTVITRRAGADQAALRWVSAGDAGYTIEAGERTGRGTDVILHLREGMDEFLDEWRIRQIVKEYSDYIAHPIVMAVSRTKKEGDQEETTVEDETLNSMKAIWRRDKKDIPEQEYLEFYTHISHDHQPPLRTLHYAGEGTTEFKALLFLPAQAPVDLFMRDPSRGGVQLYVKNVFITDHCKDLIPEYFRFIRGVVDSSDLPLNVSREMLQDDAVIRRIRKSVTGKVLGLLAEMKEKQADDYLKFYTAFGRVIKEGVHHDFENHDKLKDLLLFATTKTEDGRPADLKTYVGRMPESQKAIYYLTADSLAAARGSPQLEVFQARGIEVLFLTDPIDEWVTMRLTEYGGKPLHAIDRGDLNLDGEEGKKEQEAKRAEASKEYKDLLDLIRKKLDADIKEVRLSGRLTDSACCLVADEHAMTANMERIMRSLNQGAPPAKRILELNPTHPVLARMKAVFETDRNSPRLADYADLLHGQALIAEGSPIKDPLRFTKLVSDLMAHG